MDQSTVLTLVGVVLALVFVLQTMTGGWRRAVPQLFGIALVIAAIAGYFVYAHRQKATEVQELARRRAGFASRLLHFAAKYNAVTDWQEALDGKSGRVYTVDLQKLFVRQDDRPVMVFALVRNISEASGSTEVYLDEAGSLESRFKLQLDCPLAHSFGSDNSSYGFEVIVQIRSFEPVQAGEYSLAKGRCVDLMPVSIGDYFDFVVGPELEKHRSQKGG